MAVEICQEPRALEFLEQLSACSLVLADGGGEAMRFRLLEVLREYAREQLTAEEWMTLQHEHAVYFRAMAEAAEPEMTGPDQGAWLARMDQEHDNFRAALAWCLEQRDATEGLRLAGALWEFWWVRGYMAEGRESLAAVLTLPAAAGHTLHRAKALRGAGNMALHARQFETARALLEESLAISRALADRPGEAIALYTLAWVAQSSGDEARLVALAAESFPLVQKVGNTRGLAVLHQCLGDAALERSDREEAKAHYQRGLALFRERGGIRGIAYMLYCLGALALADGDLGAARTLVEEALPIQRALGFKVAIAGSLRALGEVALRQGDIETARTCHTEALELCRQAGSQEGVRVEREALTEIARAAALRETHV
jgi:tetratricopeptide (TPR) repeat protein